MSSEHDLLSLIKATGCPQCQDGNPSKVLETDLGYGSFILTCSGCEWVTGVDDSVNLCDLGTDGWVFEPDKEGSCLENEVHCPVFIAFDKAGLILSQCARCKKQGTTYYKNFDSNALYDAVFDAVRRMSAENLQYQGSESSSSSEMLTEENSICDNAMPVDNESDNDMVPKDNDFVCVCDCGNNEKDCFEMIYDSFGVPSLLKCLGCNMLFSCNTEAVYDSYIACEKCKNNNEDFFKKTYNGGKLVEVKCWNCDSEVKFSGVSEKNFDHSTYIHKDRIDSWDQLERGNHISWQRGLSYEHHAIVLAIDQNNNCLSVIEYGSHFDNIGDVLSLARVQERNEKIEKLKDVFLYRYDYDPENCFAPEKVVERARSRIGERRYNVLLKNCEHFATWCKTGKEFCSQIIPMTKRAALTTVAFLNQLAKPVIDLIKQEVFQMIAAGASVDDIVDFAAHQLNGIKVDRAFTIGRIGFTILLNLIIELAMFYHNYQKYKKEFDEGRTDKTEFRKQVFQLAGESTGGLLLGLLFGFSWLLLGPGIFPTVFTVLLNILGIIGGRLLGAFIGRKLHDKTLTM